MSRTLIGNSSFLNSKRQRRRAAEMTCEIFLAPAFIQQGKHEKISKVVQKQPYNSGVKIGVTDNFLCQYNQIISKYY
jgi:hypothetical protein